MHILRQNFCKTRGDNVDTKVARMKTIKLMYFNLDEKRTLIKPKKYCDKIYNRHAPTSLHSSVKQLIFHTNHSILELKNGIIEYKL
jgi:hypothetical protein